MAGFRTAVKYRTVRLWQGGPQAVGPREVPDGRGARTGGAGGGASWVKGYHRGEVPWGTCGGGVPWGVPRSGGTRAVLSGMEREVLCLGKNLSWFGGGESKGDPSFPPDEGGAGDPPKSKQQGGRARGKRVVVAERRDCVCVSGCAGSGAARGLGPARLPLLPCSPGAGKPVSHLPPGVLLSTEGSTYPAGQPPGWLCPHTG